MVFIPTAKPAAFEADLLDAILLNVNPFFMVRLKHEKEKHGRCMQGAVIERPQDIPDAAEVLYMPGVRGPYA